MKKITILTLLMTLALTASAISLPDSLNYTVRLGYNIGGWASMSSATCGARGVCSPVSTSRTRR